ncbi:HlyC/CorC family transporter [Peptostreptococcus russellii]|uniref:HlyC/CorC family transporter n=1 Tax=Peptostreptococcus russellii TaxID=215200 RepID=UPI000D0F80AA|nr:hemolysin family protein [Peptostreptococcus russellii]
MGEWFLLDSGGLWIQVVILFILLSISAFFSAAETALTSISKVRVRHLKEEGVKGASVLEKLISEPKKLLSTVLVVNNIVNIAATSISTSVMVGLFGSQGVAWATAIMTVLILVFGEVTPKTLASNNKEGVSLAVAKILNLSIVIFAPLVFLINLMTTLIFKILRIEDDDPKSLVTEEELKAMVNFSHEEGVLEQEEKAIIDNVFEFGDMKAENAMIQRIDMVTVSADANYDEVLNLFKEEKMSRFPVYRGNIDDIVGILNIKDIIFLTDEEEETFKVEDYMRDVFFTYEFKKISQLLEEMKLAKTQIAIVLDEYGGTSGLLTIEDLVEVLVGDIEDEYDEHEDEIVKISNNEYIVDGSTKISDVNEYLHKDIESGEFDSIGGYIIGYLNRLPIEGEEIELNNFIRVKVLSLDKNRIAAIRMMIDDVEEIDDEISFREYKEKESNKDND